jgi:excinuclease ABC subunit C
MDLQNIIASINTFPETPGVYLMKDEVNNIIYIGKASNLKNRVRSYFLDKHEDRPQIPFMLSKLHHIDWIVTRNETEAIILEANLIRKHKPKFNIELKDDKHFPYIKVTINEKYPRILIVRKIEDDGAKYFGPYTDVRAMRRLVNFSKKIFKIRDCNKNLPLKKNLRPCINFNIGICSGICAEKISISDYYSKTQMLIQFLSGKRKNLLENLRQQMKKASEDLRFEEAALLRDQINLIENASNMQKVDLNSPDFDCDVFGFYKSEKDISLAVLKVLEGLLISCNRFIFKQNDLDDQSFYVEGIILQYYLEKNELPAKEVLVSKDVNVNVDVMNDVFKRKGWNNVNVIIPVKGDKRKLCEMAEKNARLYLIQKISVNIDIDLNELKNILYLPKIPKIIEAFDISNLGQSYAVASMVRFKNQTPDKSGYRRYKIKTIEGQNDFAMINEVVSRRLLRQKEENKAFADLYLIDGGLGQLHAAIDACKVVENPPMIISIAKKEETIFSPYCNSPIRLDSSHPVRRFLERIRDEAHRFAISYHRTLRGKTLTISALESIPGIGKKTIINILKHFGSLKRTKEADVEEISKVKGISKEKAKEIKAFLEKFSNP